MRTKFLLALISFFLAFSDVQAQPKDVVESLAGYVRSSNSSDLSTYFSSVIELSMLNDEDKYSRAQAELILRSFFFRHKPVSVKIIRRINPNANYIFAVFSFLTKTDKFRFTISLRNQDDKFLVREIRIDYDEE